MALTPLNAIQCLLGARLVKFCGWQLPLHYGSQIGEHHAVRRDCGVFDISHMCAVDVEGKDAALLLRRLLANDVAKLQPGKALYSCMLNDAGGILDDLIVYDGGGNFRVVVNACTADQDLAWMAGHAAGWGMQVCIVPRRDLAMLAVQGPNARARVWQVRPSIQAVSAELAPFHAVSCGDLFIARTGYTGEDGFEISLPAAQAETLWQQLVGAGASPCGLGARDTLRLEAGMCLYGQDMDDSVTPYEAGLGWTVAMNAEHDFVGRAALLSRSPRWQMVGLLLPQGGILRHGQTLLTAHGAGMVTSGSFSPTLQQSIALARLPPGVAAGDGVAVKIRGKQLPVRVVKPPFVRQGRILV